MPQTLLFGGVLIQNGYPIAYESWKLNETERRYTVQEKELTDWMYIHIPGRFPSINYPSINR